MSCIVHWLDKKRNKPLWSGEGSSEIKRFKAPFAHEYLMPIWGESQWSSVSSWRCRRKSTLSASGHFSTVSYVNVPPHSCCANELCSSCSRQMKIVLLIWNHCRLGFSVFLVLFFLLRLASQNIVKWFILSFKKQTLFHTVRLPIPADTEQLFGSDLASESFSAQLNVGSSQQIKISSWQSQTNQVVKWPQFYFDTRVKEASRGQSKE